MKRLTRILFIIVFAQFLCTSLWFAGNGVMADLLEVFELNTSALGHLTSAVQLGFISGTLIFAVLTIADRYPPSKVFFLSAIFGATFNLGMIWPGNNLISLLCFRFMTGFFLAGIYPVGMKIAADYFDKGLGKSLGYLVGALVMGTALPHLLKGMSIGLSWKVVLISVTGFAILGGILINMGVPTGPYHTRNPKLDLTAIFKVFEVPRFRRAALGYFGHMWELYTFWTFVPIMLTSTAAIQARNINISLWSFMIIGIGGVACVIGGYISLRRGVKKVALLSLLLSGVCCLLSPWMLNIRFTIFTMFFLLVWGMVVIADSPLFSTMVARNADPKIKGSALTIVNCIGFSITILSIQLITFLYETFESNMVYMLLALGPILGLLAQFRIDQNK